MPKPKLLHVIPAEPGTVLLYSGVTDGAFWVSKTTVIGWAHSDDPHSFALDPVTTEGVWDDQEQILPILHGNGMVDVPVDRSFDDEAAWREWAEQTARGTSAG